MFGSGGCIRRGPGPYPLLIGETHGRLFLVGAVLAAVLKLHSWQVGPRPGIYRNRKGAAGCSVYSSSCLSISCLRPSVHAHVQKITVSLEAANMKRKLFGLAPVISKVDVPAKATPEPTPSAIPLPHRQQHQSHDIVSPLNSPWCSRQTLTPKTERELRAACALILQNFKPSDHGLTDVDPKLDFQGMQRRREGTSGTVKVHRPSGAPADATKHAHAELPAQANTGRQRTKYANATPKEHESRKNKKPSSSEPPRPVIIRHELESDDNKSIGTPLTGSTDAHLNHGSTAPTSAALTSRGSSKRTSHQFENSSAVAEARTSERKEMEQRSHLVASQPRLSCDTAPARPPSRAKSIRSDIKGYIFPKSASLSRTQSHESLHTTASRSSSQKESKGSASSHGWRSWNFDRISSSRTSSRPGSSKGRGADRDHDKKNELNLNRELPPLPSLDSWRQHEQPPVKESMPQSPSHIATVMLPQDQRQQDYAVAARRSHRRSGSDTLALHHETASRLQSLSPPARTSSQQKPHAKKSPLLSPPLLDRSMDFDEMMSAMDPSRNAEHQSQSDNLRKSTDGNHLAAPNFSRKISADISRPRHSGHGDHPYQNVVQVAGKQKEENKSKLKKVLSGWMLRKDKKDSTWMDQLEKNGVKGGVMIQDEAALAPVVKY